MVAWTSLLAYSWNAWIDFKNGEQKGNKFLTCKLCQCEFFVWYAISPEENSHRCIRHCRPGNHTIYRILLVREFVAFLLATGTFWSLLLFPSFHRNRSRILWMTWVASIYGKDGKRNCLKQSNVGLPIPKNAQVGVLMSTAITFKAFSRTARTITPSTNRPKTVPFDGMTS